MDHLEVPAFLVECVEQYIDAYLDEVWIYKHHARPRQKKLPPLELAARTAILGLSDHHDLARLWEYFEHQVAERLQRAPEANWASSNKKHGNELAVLASALLRASHGVALGQDPLRSKLSMDAVFANVSREYSQARESIGPSQRSRFDEAFQQWLYWAYDPLYALSGFFGSRESEAGHRMRRGTGGRVNEAEILDHARSEWKERGYGPEDRPWLAWLLRFALPSPSDPQKRFRGMPSSLTPAMSEGRRWTHIVIDEAQDLCVAEASLLGSLVDPDGALTVSADFRQIVSPVHGMRSADSLHIGRSLHGKDAEQIYPFARNMRQSKQIGKFLQGFYEVAFRERPAFDVNPELDDKKPQVIVAPPHDHALRIKQIVSVLRRSDVVSSIALLQINEDNQALTALRDELSRVGVPLAPIWAGSGEGLLTTSVEHVKGLEFDACIVLGLEDVENAALIFTLNRAYVALSRPARRLAMICSEYPPLLREMDKSLFEVTQS